MITTLDLVSPVADQEPGSITIVVSIESDNEQPNFTESFSVRVNDLPAEFEIVEILGAYSLTSTITLFGPQQVKVTAEAKDNDEGKLKNWIFNVLTERTTSVAKGKRANLLQSITSYFPNSTKARGNKYSLFQQFMNIPSLELERIKLKLHQLNRGLNFHKLKYNDPEW